MYFTVHGILQARILEWVAMPFSRDLPNAGIEPTSPALQVDSLPAEPPGKPKNTGVGSLTLLQQVFPTQELTRGLLYLQANSLPTELSGKSVYMGKDSKKRVYTCMKGKVTQLCPTLYNPMDFTVHGILQARILEWVAMPFSRDLPNAGIEPTSPSLQMDSSPSEPPRKPKNTGVGSLSLLQRIFTTQELTRSLLYLQANS